MKLINTREWKSLELDAKQWIDGHQRIESLFVSQPDRLAHFSFELDGLFPVGDHERHPVPAMQIQRRLAIGGLEDVVAQLLEIPLQHAPGHAVVFDDQDPQAAVLPSSAPESPTPPCSGQVSADGIAR